MDSSDVADLQDAVDALNEREIEPFVALMADDMKWKGVRSGLRWWRHRPH